MSLEGTTGGGIVTPPLGTTDIDDTLQSLPDGDEKGAKKSQAKKALTIVGEYCPELFLDQFGSHYAAVRIGEHLETLQDLPDLETGYARNITNLKAIS